MHRNVDVALVLLYTVVWTIVEFVRLPSTRASMARAPLGGRAREYGTTMLIQWSLTGLVLARLAYGRLPWSSIGLNLPRGIVGWAASAAALAVTLWALRAQSRTASRSGAGRAALARELSKIAWWLPRERREFAAFSALSVTAGVCEEVLFRGHLLAFLDPLVGPFVGTALAVAIFGLGHSYQGANGVVRAAVVGLFLALVYRATGSLLAPIVAHALIDWSGGRMIERALREGVDLAQEPQPVTA